MSWCFYFHFTRAIQSRKKLIYVEVRPQDTNISRTESKQNLNTVIESNMRKKNTNQLFDKFWYITREQRKAKAKTDGLVVDSQQQVCQLNSPQVYKNEEKMSKNQEAARNKLKEKSGSLVPDKDAPAAKPEIGDIMKRKTSIANNLPQEIIEEEESDTKSKDKSISAPNSGAVTPKKTNNTLTIKSEDEIPSAKGTIKSKQSKTSVISVT